MLIDSFLLLYDKMSVNVNENYIKVYRCPHCLKNMIDPDAFNLYNKTLHIENCNKRLDKYISNQPKFSFLCSSPRRKTSLLLCEKSNHDLMKTIRKNLK